MTKTNRNLALITGGAKRIGAGIARSLADLGYDISISYHSSKDEAISLCSDISRESGVNCDCYKVDLFDLDEVKKFSKKFFSDNKNCNLLVNNASIFERSLFLENDVDELVKNMNIHLNSPLILAKDFAVNSKRESLSDGQIINLIDKRYCSVVHTKPLIMCLLMHSVIHGLGSCVAQSVARWATDQ